ncbi:MAG: hypothetical protein DCC55_26195 [Chloroflexi bacterium]|nr:MAG: hypothetical protein DCC55_26195 [Chloroflexota bacterium]
MSITTQEIIQDMAQYIEAQLAEAPQVRGTTRGLLVNLSLDLPLSWAQVDDFGVKSDMHYRALCTTMHLAVEQTGWVSFALELDQALGHGKRLTQLVQHYAPEYEVTFTTVWDELAWR